MKIAFAFPTNRNVEINEVKKGLTPDNALYGFNYLDKKDHAVECEVNTRLERAFDVVLHPINQLFMAQIDIDFKIARALLMTRKLNSADVIVSNIDGISLAICFLKRLGLIKPPVIYSIGLFYIQGKMAEAVNSRKNNLFLNFYKWMLQASDQLLYHAEIEKEKLRKLGLLDPAKTTFITIGSDDKFFNNPPKKARADVPSIVSVGKDRARDYKTLIKAAKELPDLKFLIICRKSNIQELDIPNNVKLLFNVPYRRVRDFYNSATIVVIPIKEMYRSSGQMTLTDCMQVGVPVIISRVVGISHYPLVNNRNCVLVSPGNTNHLKKATKSLTNDANLRHKLTTNIKKISKQFTTKHYSDQLRKVIDWSVDENQLASITKDDLTYLMKIRNENNKYFLTTGEITFTQQKEWYRSYLKKNSEGSEYMYILKINNKKYGTGAIYEIDYKKSQAKIGRFIIEKSQRGRGYGDILLKKITYIAFEKLNLEKIGLEVLASNKQAIKRYLKSGFKPYKKQTEKGVQIILMSKAKNS